MDDVTLPSQDVIPIYEENDWGSIFSAFKLFLLTLHLSVNTKKLNLELCYVLMRDPL